MRTTFSMSDLLLIVGIVGGLMLIAGAGLRPLLEDFMDRLGRRLRIEVQDDRKTTIYVPDGIQMLWNDLALDRVIQQQVVLENNTSKVFHEVRLLLRFRPFLSDTMSEPLLLGAVIPPTPVTRAELQAELKAGERVVEFDYISPHSQVMMLVFTNHDGEIDFETLCDREVVVRHTGVMFSESVESVMPGWMSILKPIVLPFTIVGVIRRKLRRSRKK